MAHDIYFTAAGTASMAFVGQTPWHNLGQALTRGASLETWREQAGLNWEAMTAPVQFAQSDGTMATYDERKVIYRGDTGAPLSVMGDGYNLVQPGQVLEFFRDITEQAGWYIHTAGVLDGGRKIWTMASHDGADAEVVPGDRVTGNLLMATSLDGSSATCVGMTSVRVVCANTWGQAMRRGLRGYKAATPGARVSHRTVFDADAVKREIGIADDIFAEQIKQAQTLAAQSIGTDEARELLRQVFGQPTVRKSAARAAAQASRAIEKARTGGDTLADLLQGFHVPRDPYAEDREARELLASALCVNSDLREQRSVARCLELFSGAGRGATHDGVMGTKWGLFNAVTEHVDHEQGRTDDTRMQSAWFGRGADFKASALSALLS